jgi:hypothetical protein
VGHKPPIGHSPAHRDVCFSADSPPHSPLPLPHYLHNNTLPHRRRCVALEDPTLHYRDETGSNVYLNADNTGNSAVYDNDSYTHLASESQHLELYQVGEKLDYDINQIILEAQGYLITVIHPVIRLLMYNITSTKVHHCI